MKKKKNSPAVLKNLFIFFLINFVIEKLITTLQIINLVPAHVANEFLIQNQLFLFLIETPSILSPLLYYLLLISIYFLKYNLKNN
jgi:hypothetical protein